MALKSVGLSEISHTQGLSLTSYILLLVSPRSFLIPLHPPPRLLLFSCCWLLPPSPLRLQGRA